MTFQVRPHPRWNDGIFVLNDARDFPDVPLDHHALRIGNLLPVRAFLELFGYGQVAYYAWPFVTAILLVVAVFALGVVLFDRWTAAAATVLLIFHPVLVDTVINERHRADDELAAAARHPVHRVHHGRDRAAGRCGRVASRRR